MFYFIRKKIVVDCFINIPHIIENYPIRKAIKACPKWWKDLPPTFQAIDKFLGTRNTLTTMKTCEGFTNLFSQSWVYPLWGDYQVLTHDSGNYLWKSAADFCPPLDDHPTDQYGNAFSEYIHIKAKSPWLFFEKTGVDFAFVGNDWDLLKSAPQLRIVPGVLNFKRNNIPNVNFFLPKTQATHQLPAGLPFVHLIPLTEKQVEFKMHYLTEAEMVEKHKLTSHFDTRFRNRHFLKTTL